MQLVSEWRPAQDKRISVVSCNSNQLVCASGYDLYYIEIHEGKLIETG